MAIQVEDLCYTYGEGTALERQALKHVSFEIQDGEFVGLIGHTGSGKSNPDPAFKRSDQADQRRH